MRRPRIVFLSLVSVLLPAILWLSLSLDARSNLTTPPTPIPASALAAFKPGEPITTPIQAFVAAQFYLGTTRLRAAGEILPYSAETMRYAEAIARTRPPGLDSAVNRPGYSIVWLVIFEGQWFIEAPVPDATPTAPGHGCVYAILDARDGDGVAAGGIRECADYQAETGEALFTWQGDLLLMKPDGQTQLIASQIGLGRSDFTRLLSWSPDGSYLFVSDRGTAWVVSFSP